MNSSTLGAMLDRVNQARQQALADPSFTKEAAEHSNAIMLQSCSRRSGNEKHRAKQNRNALSNIYSKMKGRSDVY